MRYVFLGNTLQEWGVALAVALGAAVLMYVTKCFVLRRLEAIARRTQTRVDDWFARILRSTYVVFMVVLALYLGSLLLDLPKKYGVGLWRIAVTAMMLQGALWGDAAVRSWRARLRANADSTAGATSAAIIDFVLRLLVWVVFTLMILDNLGFNITTLVASLGIGGIAVALAVQNILGDLLASLSIVLDKPFVVGDFIIVGENLGTVEYIGLKTTRLRGLGGDQIIFSNGDILKSRIGNQTRMETRRAAFVIRVRYGTDPDKLAAIPDLVKEIVLANERTANFERAHLFQLGEWSLNYEVVYWIKSPDYFVFMDTQQAIYLALIRAFQERDIDFAIPMRMIVRDPDDKEGELPPFDRPQQRGLPPAQTH
ncbi:mechanosensitive ion channel family protein [Massilia endophytica]|uniref:mechanosensitive ion channel family protein n=1 Tax=Massilia endophytica TaxID=2899220 RepID=UPI001E2B6B03|nr:mechanosensitive ion channel family protein [Massilia endophytica]UGQ46932.1 mechanosensitive ion channel family protein [Massilia endophytica]